MSSIVEYYLDAIGKLSRGENVPYPLDSKMSDLAIILSHRQNTDIIHAIVSSSNAADCFRYLNKLRILGTIFPLLNKMKTIPQAKHSKNVFEHTIRVLDQVPIDDPVLRWVALFHDFGKLETWRWDKNFRDHAEVGAKLAEELCSLYSVQDSEAICAIIKYHMFPLMYQRTPNWTDSGFDRFIEKCGGYASKTVQFAIYDKKAENDNEEFLQPLYSMMER